MYFVSTQMSSKKNVKERHLWDYSGELRLSVGERTASEPLQHLERSNRHSQDG